MYKTEVTNSAGEKWIIVSRVPVDPESNPHDMMAQMRVTEMGILAMNFWGTVQMIFNPETTDVERAADLVDIATRIADGHLA